MKKTIATALLTTAMAFAQQIELNPPAQNLLQLEVKPALPMTKEKPASRRSFGYLRMGVSDTQLPKDPNEYLPGIGLGYRLADENGAIDISASFSRRTNHTEEGKQKTLFYTLPKANYLYYITPSNNTSLYAGGGLAWGGMETKDDREFQGLISNVALGYEMNRNAPWHSFLQLDISQPTIAASQYGSLPGPYAELSLGAGF